jgi:hypothetical protein
MSLPKNQTTVFLVLAAIHSTETPQSYAFAGVPAKTTFSVLSVLTAIHSTETSL